MRRMIGLKGLTTCVIAISAVTAEAQQPLYGRSTVSTTPAVTGIYDALTGAGYAIYGLSRSEEGFAGFFRGRGYFSSRVQIGGANPTSFAEILFVQGNVRFVGDFQLNGILNASSSLAVGGALTVSGATSLNNALTVGGLAQFNQGVRVNNSPLTVTGETTLRSLVVSDATALNSLVVNNATTLNGGLVVNNAPAQFNQNVNVGASGAARNLTVNGNLAVSGTATLNTVSLTSLTITGATGLATPFTVSGAAQFSASVSIAQNLSVGGDTILGNVRVGSTTPNGERTLRVIGHLETVGNATVTNTLAVQGASNLGGTVTIGGGNPSPSSILTVNGTSVFNGNVDVGSQTVPRDLTVWGTTNFRTVNLQNLTVSGTSRLRQPVIIGTGDPDPNFLLRVNGTLAAGATNLAQLTVSGTSAFNGNVDVGSQTNRRNFTVRGASVLDGNVTIGNDNSSLTIWGTSTINGNVTIGNNSDLTVSRDTVVGRALTVGGASAMRGTVTIGAGTAAPNSLLTVGGNTTMRGTLTVEGDADARQNALTVNGNALFNRDVTVGTNSANDTRQLTVNGTLRVNGKTELGQVELVNLTVSGHTRLNTLETLGNVQLRNTLRVEENGVVIGSGNPSPNSLLTVNGSTSVGGALSAGATTLAQLNVNGTSTLNGNVTVANNSSLTVSGSSTLQGTVTVGTGNAAPNSLLTVNGTLTIGNNGDLSVARDATIARALTVSGNTTLRGTLAVDGTSTLRGQVAIENRLEVNQETRLNALTVDGEALFNQNLTVGAKGEPRTLEVKGNLTLTNGALVVTGAGANTPTAAFLFVYEGKPQNAALIVHPFLLAETNPNAPAAIVIATFNGTNGALLNAPYGVRYNGDRGGWEIYLLNPDETIPDGATFNVLIILPSAPQQ